MCVRLRQIVRNLKKNTVQMCVCPVSVAVRVRNHIFTSICNRDGVMLSCWFHILRFRRISTNYASGNPKKWFLEKCLSVRPSFRPSFRLSVRPRLCSLNGWTDLVHFSYLGVLRLKLEARPFEFYITLKVNDLYLKDKLQKRVFLKNCSNDFD
jgi:hypothetical protein